MDNGAPLLVGKRNGSPPGRRLYDPIELFRAVRVLDPAYGSGNVLYNGLEQCNESLP